MLDLHKYKIQLSFKYVNQRDCSFKKRLFDHCKIFENPDTIIQQIMS